MSSTIPARPGAAKSIDAVVHKGNGRRLMTGCFRPEADLCQGLFGNSERKGIKSGVTSSASLEVLPYGSQVPCLPFHTPVRRHFGRHLYCFESTGPAATAFHATLGSLPRELPRPFHSDSGIKRRTYSYAQCGNESAAVKYRAATTRRRIRGKTGVKLHLSRPAHRPLLHSDRQ